MKTFTMNLFTEQNSKTNFKYFQIYVILILPLCKNISILDLLAQDTHFIKEEIGHCQLLVAHKTRSITSRLVH